MNSPVAHQYQSELLIGAKRQHRGVHEWTERAKGTVATTNMHNAGAQRGTGKDKSYFLIYRGPYASHCDSTYADWFVYPIYTSLINFVI